MEYLAVCNQMKAIRQDLTVQGIRNSFAIEVYETHARMALGKADFDEFNQCQTKLAGLYETNPGRTAMEFVAYRLLFGMSYDSRGHTSLLQSLQTLTEEEKQSEEVKHAMCAFQALYTNNYRAFLKLQANAPHLGGLVMQRHVKKVRGLLLQSLSRAHRTPVPLPWLASLLGYESTAAARPLLGVGPQVDLKAVVQSL